MKIAMNPKIILCLALVLSGGLFGCSTVQHSTKNVHLVGIPLNVFEKVEQQIPKIAPANVFVRTPASNVWHGEESVSANFYIQNNPGYAPIPKQPPGIPPPSGFSGPSQIPVIDLSVTITRYASSIDATQAVEQNLMLRPVMFPSKNYKGATLYDYSSGVGNMICQSGEYVIEIELFAEAAGALKMKVLNAVLTELDSTSSRSK